ncbi:MAG TPA: aldo/keto reductase [Candidatus Hydrogenedentes bacterium]|nr:aldo/keto reductase [Candidatus Hydrogenedentota bacterium]HQM47307.1 aldo/keto reductase [Candidatus Hydrogenedentota bacterium]
MRHLNRRDFLRFSAATAAASLAFPAATQEPAPHLTAQTTRMLGKTGIQCSLLGQGTGMRGWNGNSDMTRLGRNEFVKLLEHGYANGIRFYDLADMYGSHTYLREAMKRSIKREDVMILSKAVSRAPALMKADLERFRHEIGTDYIDVVLMHCITEPDWTERPEYQASLEVMHEAKAKGKVRAVGCSCHSFDALQKAAASPHIDVILARYNPFGIRMDDTVENVTAVLRQAHDAGKGILGMKIVGEGQLTAEPAKINESVKFILTSGIVDAITIGFTEQAQVNDMISRIDAATRA